jgi:hypothetical protein
MHVTVEGEPYEGHGKSGAAPGLIHYLPYELCWPSQSGVMDDFNDGIAAQESQFPRVACCNSKCVTDLSRRAGPAISNDSPFPRCVVTKLPQSLKHPGTSMCVTNDDYIRLLLADGSIDCIYILRDGKQRILLAGAMPQQKRLPDARLSDQKGVTRSPL